MARRREDRVDVAELDDLPRVHDDHAVGHLGDQSEVVRDQDRRGVRLVLCRLQHLENLRLDRDVKCGRRLVGDQQGRLVRDRHRNHRALPHPAGELVRILLDPPLRLGDAHRREKLDRPPLRVGVPDVGVVRLDRLRELVADLQHRVERGHRILEDDRHVVAAHAAQLLLRQLQEVAALEDRLAARDLAGRYRDEPEDRHRANALAGSRLADDAEGLSRIDVVGDAIHRPDDSVVGRELDREIADRKNRIRHERGAELGRGRRADRRR